MAPSTVWQILKDAGIAVVLERDLRELLSLNFFDKTATRVLRSRWRKRKTSSSINVVLPAPPGPVKPITFDVRFLVRAGLVSFDG